jgi:hypothetical protein
MKRRMNIIRIEAPIFKKRFVVGIIISLKNIQKLVRYSCILNRSQTWEQVEKTFMEVDSLQEMR